MKTLVNILIIITLLLWPLTGFSQDGGFLITQGVGNFFVAVIAGILLAFAFQFLLTNLAVAAGITAVGDIRPDDDDNSSSSSGTSVTAMKISNGLGIFVMLTMTISVFFATLIAVKLSLISSNIVGFSLGLVIWSGYLLLGLYLDSKLVSSAAGMLFSAVKGTLTTGAETLGSTFSSSPKSQMKSVATEAVKAIHDEIRQEYDLSEFQQKMDEYVNKLQPQKIDMNNLHHHFADLLNDLEIKEKYTPDDLEAYRHLFVELADKQSGFTENEKRKMKNSFQEAIEVFKKEGSRMDKAAAAFDKISPGDESQGREYRQKIEQYLQQTGREEIQPETLKNDLNRILNNPKAAPEVIQARASMIDRSTLKAVLSSRQGIDEQKAEEYLNKAEELLNQIKSKASALKGQSEVKVAENRERISDRMNQMKEQRSRAEQAISQWFNRMNQPELNYDRLKYDVQQMMDDPKATPEILKSRLNKMDRDSLIALMSNNKRISREQAERAVSKVEEAREVVVRRAEEIEQRVKNRIKETRAEAWRQAEATRKAAAVAAWWVFAAAVVSGGAAALGGILALT